jgi:hypothetical protein
MKKDKKMDENLFAKVCLSALACPFLACSLLLVRCRLTLFVTPLALILLPDSLMRIWDASQAG